MIKVLVKETGEVKRIELKVYLANRDNYTTDLSWKKPVKKNKKKVVVAKE